MARRVIPRALRAAFATFVLLPGELVFAQDQSILYVGDGVTPGGLAVAGINLSNLISNG